VTSMSSFPVMKIKMSPVANEISIKWILWTRFHHFLETLTLSWLQVDSNCLLNRRIHVFLAQFLLKMRPHEKSRTGNDEIEYIAKEIGTFGLVHRSRRKDQLQISSTAIEMFIFYWC
jgi:hypothetical protein